MEKLARIILKFRLLIIILTAAITIFLGLQIPKLNINSDFIRSLPDDDPIARTYKYIGDEFKGTDLGIIIVQTENIYQKEIIAYIAQITDSLRVTEGVNSVTSLTNIMYIESDTLGFEISKLIDEFNLPQTEEEIAAIKQKIVESENYEGVIVSEDETTSIIMFVLSNDIDQSLVSQKIEDKINSLNLPLTLHFGGMPLMLNDISGLILQDLQRLIPFIAIVLILVLFLCFGTLRGVILPLLCVAIGAVWTLGIMSLLGYDLTMVSANIPVVLFAIGTAYTIHVINFVVEHKELNYYEALKQSVSYLIVPVFLSAITTIFGFISFVFGAYLTMIIDFGIFSAVGTFIVLILSLTFIPALLHYFPTKNKKEKSFSLKKSIITNYLLKPLLNLILTKHKTILIFWIIATIISVSFSFRIVRSSDVSTYFKKNSPTRISENILQTKFGGSSPIYIKFEGDIQSPAVLNKMSELEDYLLTNEFIYSTTSIAGIIEEMNNAMGEGFKIPDDKAKIEQLWFLIEGQEVLPQLVNEDLTKAIIQSRFASTKTKDVEAFIHDIEKWIINNQSDDYKIVLSGMPSVYSQIDKSLLRSQMSSLGIAIILVYIIISLIIKSAKLGLYGTIPILAGISLLFGFMGLTGIPLDFATVLVAGAALGIGIDYSIHVINAYKQYKTQYDDINTIIEKTILINGKAIVINFLTVSAGFLVLLFSQILPMQYFGLLISLSMILSGFGALTLLPVLLIYSQKKSKI